MSTFRLLLITAIAALATSAHAGLHLGASGSWAKNHLGLQTHTTNSYKGSLALDLGSYFRIGYSYRQSLQHREGYVDKSEEDEEKDLVYFEQDVLQNAHGLDFFVILYAGEVFTPYIFVGGALKSFKITYKEEGDEEEDVTNIENIPGVNYGVGLAIMINKNFSLKLTNTWSTGISENLEGEQRQERDSQLDVGISYKIQ